MNVWGTSNRSWRKARKRAVSPIIATILLVAITVVLAAVLYVLISGLTKGPGATPIGSAFGMGSPVGGTCTAAGVTAKTCAVAGDEIFTLTIEQSTINLGNVLLEVKTPSGSAFTNTLAGSFAIVSITGAEVAFYSVSAGAGMAMTGAWTNYAGTNSASTPIATTMTVVVDTGIVATSWATGQGNYVVGLGVGSFAGSTSATNTVLP
jgi:flagellin-like protein